MGAVGAVEPPEKAEHGEVLVSQVHRSADGGDHVAGASQVEVVHGGAELRPHPRYRNGDDIEDHEEQDRQRGRQAGVGAEGDQRGNAEHSPNGGCPVAHALPGVIHVGAPAHDAPPDLAEIALAHQQRSDGDR